MELTGESAFLSIFWSICRNKNEDSVLSKFNQLNFDERDDSFSTYAKFSEKLFLLPGIRQVSFSESFAYVLNERSRRLKV